MGKSTLHTTNFHCEVVEVKGEHQMKITCKGITHNNYIGHKTSFADNKINEVVMYMPLYSLPWFMRLNREAVAVFEKKQLEFINRIKGAFQQEVRLPEEK